jgi:2-dehydro-3-deoxy-D-arabinonate dehydratase
LPGTIKISIKIMRAGTIVFEGSTALNQIKRTFESLAEFLFRDNTFPHGCYLMTGTGIVPDDNFTLQKGDEVCITIPTIGTLINPVA